MRQLNDQTAGLNQNQVVESPETSNIAAASPAKEVVSLDSNAVEVTEFLLRDGLGEVPPIPNPLRHPIQAVAWIVRTLFGLTSQAVTVVALCQFAAAREEGSINRASAAAPASKCTGKTHIQTPTAIEPMRGARSSNGKAYRNFPVRARRPSTSSK